MKAPRKTPSALLTALLRDVAPAAVPFVPRRAYYAALRDVWTAMQRVHAINTMELTRVTTAPYDPDFTETETMVWVRENHDSIHAAIGI